MTDIMSAGNLDEAVFTLQVKLEGVFPSGRKEGGIADGYIYWLISVLYTNRRTCGIMLHNLSQGRKKIAAITAIMTAAA